MGAFDQQPPEPPKEPDLETYANAIRSPDEDFARRRPYVYVPTGFAPLDSRLRGDGLPLGCLVPVVGPPSAGKTYLSIQIALGLSARLPVVILPADWGVSPTSDVLAFMEGASWQSIDESPKLVAPYLKQKIGSRVFAMHDPLGAKPSIKDAFDTADSLGSAVVLLDSVQSVDCSGIPDLPKSSEMLSYNRAFSRYCRLRAAKGPHIVLAACEANRAFFASRDANLRGSPMSAASGGGIEYAADMMLVISRPDPDAKNHRRLDFCKRRLLKIEAADSCSASYLADSRLTEILPEEEKAASRAARQENDAPIKSGIREYLKNNPGASENAISKDLKRTFGRNRVIDVLAEMVNSDKSVVRSSGSHGAKIHSLAY